MLILSYIKYKHLQNPFNTILLSMSCNDALYLTFVLPVLLAVYVRGEWLPQYTATGDVDIMCVYVELVLLFCEISALLHVLVVGFYRYTVVVHPFGRLERINKSRRYVTVIITSLYLFVFLLWTVPMIQGFSTVDIDQQQGLMFVSSFDTRRMLCRVPCLGPITNVVLIFGAFTVITALCVMYGKILMATRRSRKIRATTQGGGDSKATNTQKKEVRFILTVSLLLFVCIIGYTALPIIATIASHIYYTHALFFPFVVLNWVPPSCNWLIYTALTKDFTEAYKALLCPRLTAGGNTHRGKSHVTTTVVTIG